MSDLYYRKDRKGFHLRAFLKRLVRSKRTVVFMVVGFPIGFYVLFGSHGVIQRIRLQHQKTEVGEKIQRAEEEKRRLQAEVKALEGDKRAIEKIARERYGMHREGETVYKVTKKK
jgi:cell division protein FtsB